MGKWIGDIKKGGGKGRFIYYFFLNDRGIWGLLGPGQQTHFSK